MNWLARLKAETHRSTHATNATPAKNVAFVAFFKWAIGQLSQVRVLEPIFVCVK